MRRRHPLPRLWLIANERMGEALWPALARLPRGAGVVFHYYSLTAAERRALLKRVRQVAARRGLLVSVTMPFDPEPHVDGPWRKRAHGIRTMWAHDRTEATAAIRLGVHLLFVSPVFATRSHPGARTLGPIGLAVVIQGLRVPVIAVGGMNARRFAGLRRLGIYGWAGIDAWMAPGWKNRG